MYTLTRVLLIIGVLFCIYCLLVFIAMGWPWLAIAVAVFLFARYAGRGIRRLTTLGSARWADETDLRRAGMLDANTGLLLGRMAARSSRLNGILALFRPSVDARTACRDFWAALCGRRKAIVRLPNAIHTAVFGPSGGGKGVSCVVPFLLTNKESCVVIDFKGENAKLTAEHRRKAFGHNVVILDPYKQVSETPDTFNPLDYIDKNNPQAIDVCNDLAKALVVRTGDEKEPHWNDSAESWIAGMIATVVQYGEPKNGTRSLQTVRDLFSNPQKLEMAVKLMNESDAYQGMLARIGGQLSHFVDKERSSVLTTVARHLRFLDTLAVAECTKSSSFDPAELSSGKMTVYLVLPPDHMRAQAGLLRMWIGAMLLAVIRGGLREDRRVHFILDEAASLGHMEVIDDAVDKYRGYGVRLLFCFQSLGQLKTCFPNEQDQTFLSNTTQVFFGVNDNATADYVSNRLGDATVVVDSGGESRGSSQQHTQGGQANSSSGHSDTTNSNWQQQARRLLKPDEVLMLPPRDAITFTPGVPPVRTKLIRYYEEKSLGKEPGVIWRLCKAGTHLVAAALVGLLTFLMAILLTVSTAREQSATDVASSADQRAVLVESR